MTILRIHEKKIQEWCYTIEFPIHQMTNKFIEGEILNLMDNNYYKIIDYNYIHVINNII